VWSKWIFPQFLTSASSTDVSIIKFRPLGVSPNVLEMYTYRNTCLPPFHFFLPLAHWSHRLIDVDAQRLIQRRLAKKLRNWGLLFFHLLLRGSFRPRSISKGISEYKQKRVLTITVKQKLLNTSRSLDQIRQSTSNTISIYRTIHSGRFRVSVMLPHFQISITQLYTRNISRIYRPISRNCKLSIRQWHDFRNSMPPAADLAFQPLRVNG
jgi:hypothetical protein